MRRLSFEVRYRWHQLTYWWTERLPEYIAWLLPRKIAYFAFVRVTAATRQAPGPDFVATVRAWESGAGR